MFPENKKCSKDLQIAESNDNAVSKNINNINKIFAKIQTPISNKNIRNNRNSHICAVFSHRSSKSLSI